MTDATDAPADENEVEVIVRARPILTERAARRRLRDHPPP